MLEKLKSSKFLFWLVPIFIGLATLLSLVKDFIVKGANKDLKKVEKNDKLLEAEVTEIKKETHKLLEDDRALQQHINELKVSEDWHTTFRRNKDDK